MDRTQYVLFTNAYSFYSVVIPGQGINDLKTFPEMISSMLSELLGDRIVLQNFEVIDVYSTNNRSVLGSMNDMIATTKFYLSEYQMIPIEIAKKLNQTPYSYLNYNNPLAVIKRMALS